MSCHLVLEDRRLLNSAVAATTHCDLDPTARAVPDARTFVRTALSAAFPSTLLDDVLLLTSELVTNVVLHARTLVHVGVSHDGEAVLVTVMDGAAGEPRAQLSPRHPDLLAESGRGMGIVAELADDFGWRQLPDHAGKVMWFVVRKPEPVAVATAAPYDFEHAAQERHGRLV